jgi:class 3 adenylate cyclase
MNPYNCSKPGNLFVGYSDERKRMLRRIVEGKSYGLLGGRRCGKTSFLLQLEQDIDASPAPARCLLPRLLDMQEVVPRSPADFFGAIYRLTTQNIGGAQPWEGVHYQDFLGSLDRVRSALEQRFEPDWVVVLLMDELDSAADRLHDSECFQNLRNLLMVSRYSRNFRVVATGVSLLSELITDRSSPLNNLDPSYLGILSVETARELVKAGFKEGFAPSVEDALFERTGRHPYVLQGVLEILWDTGAEVDENALKAAAQRFVRDRNATFRRWLHDLGQEGCAVYQGLLDAPLSLTQLRSRVPREVSVDDGLRTLSYHGVVDDSDPDALRVSGSIFRDWFQNNYTLDNPAVPAPTYEMASVLFMDIVSYSLGSIDDQSDLLTILQKTVRESAQYLQSSAKREVLSLPTGDGMALVFLRDPVSPVKCALEIAGLLRSHPEIKLRMGIHTGPVRRHADIKEEANVVGGGINIAQRVMDCGDAGHILLSRNVAEVLEQLRGWSGCLQDLGMHEVKHGVKVHLYNLCKDGLGNPELPRKLSSGRSVSVATPKPPAGAVSRWKWLAVAGVIVLLAAAGFVLSRWIGLI